jgi:hypothetical protein
MAQMSIAEPGDSSEAPSSKQARSHQQYQQQQQYMSSTERLHAAVKAKDLALMAQMFNPTAIQQGMPQISIAHW